MSLPTHGVRECDLPFCGHEPQAGGALFGKIPDRMFGMLCGGDVADPDSKVTYICCSGCPKECFNQEAIDEALAFDPRLARWIAPCHTNRIVARCVQLFPHLRPPVQLSLNTKDPAELAHVLLEKKAVFCSVSPPRGAPTGAICKLQRTIWGNPAKLDARVERAEQKLAVQKRKRDRGATSDVAKAELSLARALKGQKKVRDCVVE